MTRLQARSLLVVLLLLVCLLLIVLNQSGRLSGLKGWVGAPLAFLQRGVSRVADSAGEVLGGGGDAEALRQRNAELEARVADLENQVVALQEDEADLQILTALLNYARSKPDYRYVAANVIGRDASPFLSYILIDLGSDAGIYRDMPVVTGAGLVGTVVEVSCCAAKVRLIIDSTSAVNVRLQTSRDEGVAVGLVAGGLELQFLSQQAQLKPGDLVLTSGLGGKYPEGLVIGAVSAVQRLDYEVLQQATIAPSVDFDRLEIVLVITNFRPVDLEPFLTSTETAP